ncbi:MAG TPA: glycosyltransferase family 4 protein [Candidatus Saccharimonadales bacterium]|jgi:glycosyltransferase involved in cell wall biosynthesis|nr:glycosyltransferase family 4 protein [Candidatus Saccharimonadales bacterium]
MNKFRPDRKLKIAVFHLAFVYSGGGEKLVLKEVEGLKKMGHRVHLFTCVVDKKRCFPDLTKNIEIQEFLPWAKPFLKNHEAFQVVLSSILSPFFAYKFKDYDLIFAANQPSLWIAYVVKLLFSKKYVGYLAQPTRFLYPRRVDKETGLYFVKKETVSYSAKLMNKFRKSIKKIDLLSVQNAEKILVNGEYMTNVIKKIYKVKAENCPAGAHYLNKTKGFKFKKTGNVRINGYILKKPYILMTNRHAWQKRFEFGLSAFSGLLSQSNNYSLVISGASTLYTNELKVEIERMGLTDKVLFIGLVKDRYLDKLYKNAAVYLYTAPQEDFGMGVIEAMGQGVPVIAWNDGGPGKNIINGKTGFLMKRGDIESFTQGLVRMVHDTKLCTQMGKNAVLEVKNKYSWKNHFYLLEDSLKSLVH